MSCYVFQPECVIPDLSGLYRDICTAAEKSGIHIRQLSSYERFMKYIGCTEDRYQINLYRSICQLPLGRGIPKHVCYPSSSTPMTICFGNPSDDNKVVIPVEVSNPVSLKTLKPHWVVRSCLYQAVFSGEMDAWTETSCPDWLPMLFPVSEMFLSDLTKELRFFLLGPLRGVLEVADITPRELSERYLIPYRTVYNWLNGVTPLRPCDRIWLAESLGVIDKLFSRLLDLSDFGGLD